MLGEISSVPILSKQRVIELIRVALVKCEVRFSFHNAPPISGEPPIPGSDFEVPVAYQSCAIEPEKFIAVVCAAPPLPNSKWAHLSSEVPLNPAPRGVFSF